MRWLESQPLESGKGIEASKHGMIGMSKVVSVMCLQFENERNGSNERMMCRLTLVACSL